MREVSCRALGVIFRAFEDRGFPREVLLQGIPYGLDHLKDAEERIEWSAFARFLRNAGTRLTDDDLIAGGMKFLMSPMTRPMTIVARMFFSTRELYEWVFSGEKSVGSQLFNCVKPRLRDVSEGSLVVDLVLDPGHEPVREFFTVSQGSVSGLPVLVGEQPARVTMTEIECGYSYHVEFLASRKAPLAGLRNLFRRGVALTAAGRELDKAREALLERYHELDAARAAVARNAAQLQTVDLLARELTPRTDLRTLGDAISRILRERLGCSAVRIWVMAPDGREEIVHSAREASGQPVQTLEFKRGSTVLGGMNVEGIESPDSAALLTMLVPWMAIALENARTFTLQQEYQGQLARVVDERTTELRRTAEQLEAALERQKELDRQRSEFFSNASHELRTPLTLMLSPVESILQMEGLPQDIRVELQGVVRSAYRMTKLVNDLLDLSKLEAGKMRLQVTATDLTRLLHEVVRPWRMPLEKRAIRLEVSLPESLPLVADPERIEQVALNLMSNAVKYTPPGGWLKIWAERQGARAHFVVENSGPGIDAEDMPRLFDRFAQSAHSRGRQFGSTGLGLPVVRELVELHGGRVEVSNVPGERVAFRVSLPITEPLSGDVRHEISAPSPAEFRQYEAASVPDGAQVDDFKAHATGDYPVILIAEDNDELRGFLARGLGTEFDVLLAANGREALRKAQEFAPDVILSDVMMPGLDGYQLCQAIRRDSSTRSIPFILLTARGELEARLIGLEGGADDYLVKPFNLEEVKTRIKGQLRLRSLSLRAAQQEKLAALGTMVAGVAHEVRNPLNGVLNSLGPLRDLLVDQPEALELVDLALQGARRVERISSQLLRQARAGEGARAEVKLEENIQLALQLLAHKTNRGPRLVPQFDGTDPTVVGEAGALNQVWINLLDNAIDAAGPQGEVQLRIRREEERAVIEVADNGPGIPARLMGRIFDPFFTTKDVGKGTGLGLSLVREIVHQHGGTVTVHSAPGAGTRFRVSLPALDAVRRAVHGS